LFNKPYFVSLNTDISDLNGLALKGLRIGINGQQSPTGQSYISVDTTINTAASYIVRSGSNNAVIYEPGSGQLLSGLGTVIPKLSGYETDLFYLEFDRIGSNADQTPAPTLLSFAYALSGSSTALDVGWRTFDEINAAFSLMTGVPVTAGTGINFGGGGAVTVADVLSGVRSQLPAVEDYPAYLSSHQTAVSQL